MGRNTLYELSDREYLRRDGGNAMEGPLQLNSSSPATALEATSKAYVDRLIASGMTLADVQTLINVLTNPGGTIDARIAAAVAAYLALAGGTMTGPLTLSGAPVNNLHAATKLYVDSLPVAGLSTYDAVVAGAGGDYTSVVTACATEAAGAKIFVKAGTYNEGADIVIKDGQVLEGENPEDTIIDWGGGNFMLTTAGAGTNIAVRGITFQAGIDTYMVYLQGTDCRVENCRFLGNGGVSETAVRISGQRGIIKDNFIDNFTKASWGALYIDLYGTARGNVLNNCHYGINAATLSVVAANVLIAMTTGQLYVVSGVAVVGNNFGGLQGIYQNGSNCTYTGNYFRLGHDDIEFQGAQLDNVFTGNYFMDGGIKATNAGCTHAVITGNFFFSGQGVEWNGHGATISGNTFADTDFVNLTAGSYENNVTGNNFADCTAAAPIVDTGTHANQLLNNIGVSDLLEKSFSKLKNTSGGALVAGDVGVLKAVAAGDEFDTTAAGGNDMVWGMLDEACNNNAYAYMQRLGFTSKLKCNGVINIGIGDLLGTFTAAGIAMQAQAGDMAFAIALEAYAGADSLGVIDAVLITPRKI